MELGNSRAMIIRLPSRDERPGIRPDGCSGASAEGSKARHVDI